ncbi:YihY/virulence factor BrkB family protein [Clostridium sp.]|uniref:YihY/virulence factor BrkB family protein n=1 Tax=Clostridium sp. TaxID=1506 RepID=UPI0025C222A8|nr:YihY/virulence factor BrkB family protein [Clostridium sp.]MCI9070458.1 YihY/virulence factor BrkB family protein [Clostridium sp.]MCI9303952.1 YihY/virulence factor BrkB family protein [Clostridium sp.]
MSKKETNIKKSFFKFIIYFIVKIKNDDIFALAAQLAYYLILSFFPFLIFLLTLIGFSNLDSMEVLGALRAMLPTSAFELIYNVIIEVIEKQNTGLLGASLLLVVWSASSAFRAVIKGINKAYGLNENRSFIKRAFIAIICTFSLAFVILLTLILLVFGGLIGNLIASYLPHPIIVYRIWNFLRYILVIFMMILIFASIYRYTPSKRLKWKEVFPGAIACTVGWLVVSLGFSFYINNFSNYSKIYGGLGAVIILITWLYLTSIILITGGEINSIIVIRKIESVK